MVRPGFRTPAARPVRGHWQGHTASHARCRMPVNPLPDSTRHNASQRCSREAQLAELIPIMGEANARECLDAPITEAQRRRLAEIVASAPRRLT